MSRKEILIGLAGKARTGKDTSANYLNDDHGLVSLSFAGPIKQAVQFMFHLSQSQIDGAEKEAEIPDFGCSPRFLFQTLGTQWGREIVHPDVWLIVAGRTMQWFKDEYKRTGAFWRGTVFSDVRFDNEAEWIRQQGGVVIHIDRRQAPAVLAHESEAGVKFMGNDIRVPNHGTIEELHCRLSDIVVDLGRGV